MCALREYVFLTTDLSWGKKESVHFAPLMEL